MALATTPAAPTLCQSFVVDITGAPATTTNATVSYDGISHPGVAISGAGAGTSPPFLAVAGTNNVVATYFDALGVVTGTDVLPVTVAAGPAGLIVPVLTVGTGGTVTANTTFTCTGGTTGVTGTLTFTPTVGTPVTVPVTGGVVAPASLGALTSGTNVTVTFTPGPGTCAPCTFAPAVITVPAQSPCQVLIIAPSGTITAGTATPVQVFVSCNGVPVDGAMVTLGGTASGTATTGTTGFGTANLTFPTAGTATITATVTTAPTTSCACATSTATPVTITVSGVTPPPTGTLTALPSCWRLNLPLPFPNLFTAVLRATVAPAQAGVAVNFYVGGQLVGTAVTDATGTATLNANLSVFQIVSPIFTATTVLGGTAVSSTAALLPCIPPI